MLEPAMINEKGGFRGINQISIIDKKQSFLFQLFLAEYIMYLAGKNYVLLKM